MKPCSLCGETKPLEEFNRENSRKDGRARVCKTCLADYKRSRVLKMFDLTEDDYEALAADGCAICGRGDADVRGHRLAIDHDHKTGAVRGVLCTYHNRLLDRSLTARLLRALADYLEDPPAERVLGRVPQGPHGSSRKRRTR